MDAVQRLSARNETVDNGHLNAVKHISIHHVFKSTGPWAAARLYYPAVTNLA